MVPIKNKMKIFKQSKRKGEAKRGKVANRKSKASFGKRKIWIFVIRLNSRESFSPQ